MKDYSKVIFEGSTFPDDPYKIVHLSLNNTIMHEYLPALRTVVAKTGLSLLMTAMAIQEGFSTNSLSYKTHNPGNIGNFDNGVHRIIPNLAAGIQLQADELRKIADGKHGAYPISHGIRIIPFYIPHAVTMGLPDWAPGYHFTFTGQLDQFIKIYSTGARCSNAYLNTICSYFKMNGVDIKPEDKLQDVIQIQ